MGRVIDLQSGTCLKRIISKPKMRARRKKLGPASKLPLTESPSDSADASAVVISIECECERSRSPQSTAEGATDPAF